MRGYRPMYRPAYKRPRYNWTPPRCLPCPPCVEDPEHPDLPDNEGDLLNLSYVVFEKYAECGNVLEYEEFSTTMDVLETTPSYELFMGFDADGDGVISFSEFVAGVRDLGY